MSGSTDAPNNAHEPPCDERGAQGGVNDSKDDCGHREDVAEATVGGFDRGMHTHHYTIGPHEAGVSRNPFGHTETSHREHRRQHHDEVTAIPNNPNAPNEDHVTQENL